MLILLGGLNVVSVGSHKGSGKLGKIMSAPRGTEQTPDTYRKLAGDLKIVMLVFQSFNTGKMDLRNDELKAIFKAIRTAVLEARSKSSRPKRT